MQRRIEVQESSSATRWRTRRALNETPKVRSPFLLSNLPVRVAMKPFAISYFNVPNIVPSLAASQRDLIRGGAGKPSRRGQGRTFLMKMLHTRALCAAGMMLDITACHSMYLVELSGLEWLQPS